MGSAEPLTGSAKLGSAQGVDGVAQRSRPRGRQSCPGDRRIRHLARTGYAKPPKQSAEPAKQSAEPPRGWPPVGHGPSPNSAPKVMSGAQVPLHSGCATPCCCRICSASKSGSWGRSRAIEAVLTRALPRCLRACVCAWRRRRPQMWSRLSDRYCDGVRVGTQDEHACVRACGAIAHLACYLPVSRARVSYDMCALFQIGMRPALGAYDWPASIMCCRGPGMHTQLQS